MHEVKGRRKAIQLDIADVHQAGQDRLSAVHHDSAGQVASTVQLM
jgi:hypothetical protein